MKKKWYKYHIGQSTVEYAVLLAVVASALIAMQVYLKRGIQGRIRGLSDQIAPVDKHYESMYADSDYTTTQKGVVVSRYKDGISKSCQDKSCLEEDGADMADFDGDGKPDASPEEIIRRGRETVYPEEQK